MRWLRIFNKTLENFSDYHLCRWVYVNKTWDLSAVFDFILTGPLLTVVISAGTIGGLLCCLTFWHSMSRFRIYYYLLALAVWDTIYIVNSFFLYNLSTLLYLEITFFGPLSVSVPFLYYLATVARTGSVWTVLIIALERYMALCHPFKFKTMDSQNRIVVALTLVGIFAFFYSALRYFELNSNFCYEISTKQFVPFIEYTWLRNSYSYWLFYRVIGGSLFYSVVPFVTLIFLTIRIILEIKRSCQLAETKKLNKNRNGSSTETMNEKTSKHGQKHRLLRTNVRTLKDKTNRWMHVGMIMKFLICHTFPTILDIWELAQSSIVTEKDWAKSWLFMSHTSILLVTLNSSLNFFIYLFTSDRFRQDCRSSLICNKFCGTSDEQSNMARVTSTRQTAMQRTPRQKPTESKRESHMNPEASRTVIEEEVSMLIVQQNTPRLPSVDYYNRLQDGYSTNL